MRSRMLLQVHDELVFETEEAELSDLADLAVEVMEGALPLDVPLEVDLKVGANWEQMDRYLHDDGTWRRVPKSAGDVAREEAEEDVAAALASQGGLARSAAPTVQPARSPSRAQPDRARFAARAPRGVAGAARPGAPAGSSVPRRLPRSPRCPSCRGLPADRGDRGRGRMRGRGRATAELHPGSRGRLAGPPSSAAMTASIVRRLASSAGPWTPGPSSAASARRVSSRSPAGGRMARERRRDSDDSDARSRGVHATRKRVGVPPGDEVLHALHDREHPEPRRIGERARKLGELRQRRGDVHPAASANDRRVGEAQEVFRLQIEGPQLDLALECPIPITRAGGARWRCSSAGHTRAIAEAAREIDTRSRDPSRGADR